MNIKYFILLLFVALVSACTEEGIATLVIEDGQPSVAKMIVGQWKPNHAEKADEDGNVIEDLDITDIPDLNFGENGSGHFGNSDTGTGGSGSGNFDWNVDEGENTGGGAGYDEKGPSVTFNGERWYIFQLTKSMLIIYRVTDKYILIYYYYRIGDYNTGNESEPTPIEKKIYRITETTSYGNEIGYSAVHIFEYDTQGRIKTYSFDDGKSAFNSDYTYKGVEEIHVSGGGESYTGYLNNNQLEKLFSITSSAQKLVATPQYNSEGYISSINNIQFIYESNNLIKNGTYTYEYTDEKNNANIDLNCIISNYSKDYENQYSHYSLFAPFGFYGKFSANLISKESFTDGYADFFYEYSYEIDQGGKVQSVIRKCVDIRNADNILNTTTFTIFWEKQ